jgi:hypothetical protein
MVAQRTLHHEPAYLSDAELHELADALAIQLHAWMGRRALRLQRSDIADLIAPYIDDLELEDQQAVPWIVWHLFQDAREFAFEQQYH